MEEVLPDTWQDLWHCWEGLYGRDLTWYLTGLLTLLRGSVWKKPYLILDRTFDLGERVCMEEISPNHWQDFWPWWEGLYGRGLTWSLTGLLTLLRGSVWKRSYLILDRTCDLAERVCKEEIILDPWQDLWPYWEGLYLLMPVYITENVFATDC